MIFFLMNSIYTNHFYPYVEDLREYISKELLEKYSNYISSSFGTFDDKIIGLVSYTHINFF